MSVTYNCIEAMCSNKTEETKGSVKNLCYLTSVDCEILSSLLWVCQAALLSIWVTLMKGERENNQRSQYFTPDTDAYLYAVGRRDWLAIQLRSDLTLGFDAIFSLLLTHLASLYHFHIAFYTPTYLRPPKPLCLTAAKG